MDYVLDTLVRAREVIVTQGWRQGPRYVGAPERHVPGRCASDALFLTFASEGHQMEANVALVEALPLVDGGVVAGMVSLPTWNDDPLRRVEEVLALYDKAIERRHHLVSGFTYPADRS